MPKKTAKRTVKKKSSKTSKQDLKSKAKAEFVKQQKKAMLELKKAKAKFLKEEKRVRAYIKNHPEKAVAVAAGLGAAFGTIIGAASRRRRKR